MPLPNHKLIPSGWAEHHRPAAEGSMTVTCRILRISDGPAPFPLPDGWTGETVVHETVCRVQELKRELNSVPADQPTTLREYLIPVPIEGLPELRSGERGDIVEAIGRRFTITNIMRGSLEFERDLICTENQTQQNP